jgi:SAM-dependent methyltransferase
LLDIGCGIGDILGVARYDLKVGLDHNQKVLDALKFRARILPWPGKIDAKFFRFSVDPVDGRYDVIVICNWIHNIEPEILRLQFEKFVNENLNSGGELIFDTVKGEHYPYCHDEVFLAKNLHVTTSLLGEYRDGQLKGGGVRRIISFGKFESSVFDSDASIANYKLDWQEET